MIKNPRKYQPLWWTIRENKKATIQLWPETITEKQAMKQYATIKKAVQKEKYYDSPFKAEYPRAVVSSELLLEERKVIFTLDTKNFEEMLRL